MEKASGRRMVTGLDEAGRSCFLFEDEVRQSGPGMTSLVWQSSLPADNSEKADTARPFAAADIHHDGSNFLLIEFPPGLPPYFHATDTLDYFVVLSGEVTLDLETGARTLRPGDFVVNRGVIHAWRNDGAETAMVASVTVPSTPVGKGRTI